MAKMDIMLVWHCYWIGYIIASVKHQLNEGLKDSSTYIDET